MFSNTFYQAKSWLDLGIATIPILARSKRPAILWKRYQSELPSIADLIRWFKSPGYNLAVVCGWQDLTVLDFDTIPAYAKFASNHPEYQKTYTVSTNRGKHIYVYCKDAKTKMTNDLDIKANGYVLTYPSIHPSGSEYKVFRDEGIMKVESLPFRSPSTVCGITINNYGTMNVTKTTVLGEQSIISKIKSCYPISALFIPVKLTGNGMAFAHCPTKAHPNGDRDPSLSLDLINNRAQCISRSDCPLHSKRGNDVIDAYQILHNLSFRQALAAMAGELGI